MRIGKMIGMLAISVLLCACAGKQQAAAPVPQEYDGVSRIEGVSLETVQQEAKVASGYENIVLHPLQMIPQLAADYPETASQFQVSMLAYLKDKKSYRQVEASESNGQQHSGRTLLVDIKITDMRIVSAGARIWAGAMAGSSYMDVYLKLTDAASQKVIHEKVIATNNNAFASAWAVGSENALPMDMGKIIGEYLYTVVPAS